jgi:lipopolysaccharide export system permease protein
MLKLLDRQLIRSYLKAYFICFISLLSLYIVIDLFTNIEDFTSKHRSLGNVARHIFLYYSYKSSYIFDKLSEAIVLLAAMFTVALMQRNNELLPLLSAGVATQRVVRPVLTAACLMLGLTVLNQEVIIPRIGDKLVNDRHDPQGESDISQPHAYESNGVHIEGMYASRRLKVVRNFCVTIPENLANRLVHLIAQEARYYPPGSSPYGEGWLMTDTQPRQLEDWNNPDLLEMIDEGKYFLHTQEVDFAVLTRHSKWFVYTSTCQLFEELAKSESKRLSAMAVHFHMRLTRPILGMILVFLGLSMILRDQNRNIFIAAGMCLIMCGMVFAAMFGCKFLGDHDFVPPALAAWMPVLFFGPVAFVLFDAVHT